MARSAKKGKGISMKPLLSFIGVIALLYIIRVPGVVSFVDGAITPGLNAVAYIVDISTHLRERHTYFYMSLWFVLLFLMRSDDYYAKS